MQLSRQPARHDWWSALVLRRALLAHDRNKTGDDAVAKIAAELSPMGSTVMRLRPPDGCKDWNDAIKIHGAEALRSSLAFIEQGEAGGTVPF